MTETRDVTDTRGVVVPGNHMPAAMDGELKGWLDNVIVPILVRKLRDKWNEEKSA